MKHIRYLAQSVVLVLLIFVAANHITFPVLKAAISGSQFRAVVAARAGSYITPGQRVNLFIGNSRIMGGINPAPMKKAGEMAYNLAYNGLYLNDLRLMLQAFLRSCRCQVETVFTNPDIFLRSEADSPGVSELQRFLSGFDPAAMEHVRQDDAQFAVAMRLFPLLHFNNEFFLRALYYALTGKDDQDYSSNYQFTINPAMEQRLRDTSFDADLDVDALQELREYLAGVGVRLVVIEPPYHRAYLDNVPGLDAGQTWIRDRVTAAGADYLDHSALFRDRPEYFSDPLHLNTAGQLQYSLHISDLMQLRQEK